MFGGFWTRAWLMDEHYGGNVNVCWRRVKERKTLILKTDIGTNTYIQETRSWLSGFVIALVKIEQYNNNIVVLLCWL
jgi:hypothetical protein